MVNVPQFWCNIVGVNTKCSCQYLCLCLYLYLRLCLYLYICICIYIDIYIYIYMYLYMYLYLCPYLFNNISINIKISMILYMSICVYVRLLSIFHSIYLPIYPYPYSYSHSYLWCRCICQCDQVYTYVILLGVYGDVNLALNQPAWPPYISPNYHPSKAVDDDLNSWGCSGDPTQPFIGVDLGASLQVRRLSINFGGEYTAVTVLVPWGLYDIIIQCAQSQYLHCSFTIYICLHPDLQQAGHFILFNNVIYAEVWQNIYHFVSMWMDECNICLSKSFKENSLR